MVPRASQIFLDSAWTCPLGITLCQEPHQFSPPEWILFSQAPAVLPYESMQTPPGLSGAPLLSISAKAERQYMPFSNQHHCFEVLKLTKGKKWQNSIISIEDIHSVGLEVYEHICKEDFLKWLLWCEKSQLPRWGRSIGSPFPHPSLVWGSKDAHCKGLILGGKIQGPGFGILNFIMSHADSGWAWQVLWSAAFLLETEVLWWPPLALLNPLSQQYLPEPFQLACLPLFFSRRQAFIAVSRLFQTSPAPSSQYLMGISTDESLAGLILLWHRLLGGPT